MRIFIPISVGELFDKFTILSIKLKEITNLKKRERLKNEYYLLKKEIDNLILIKEYGELMIVNQQLWGIENEIRKLEIKKDFGVEFIKLARQIYKVNDHRSEIKARINKYYDSEIIEVKQYQ